MPSTAVETALRALGPSSATEVAARLEAGRGPTLDALEDLVDAGRARRLDVAGSVLYAPARPDDEPPCTGACAVLGLEQLLALGRLGCDRCGRGPVALEEVPA